MIHAKGGRAANLGALIVDSRDSQSHGVPLAEVTREHIRNDLAQLDCGTVGEAEAVSRGGRVASSSLEKHSGT
jgi:hypothetical protein